MKRSCALCGRASIAKNMKRMCVGSRSTNLIMVASLSSVGIVARSDVSTVVDFISRNSRYICYSHVMQATQYLCAEIAAKGGHLSYYNGEAYVTTEDIPLHVVEMINGFNNTDAVITARDVRLFINVAFKKYPATSLWPGSGEITARSEPVVQVEVGYGDDVGVKREGDVDVASNLTTEVLPV
ncbi:hypothetical protein COOONC_02189 [Cooperia oncophora]